MNGTRLGRSAFNCYPILQTVTQLHPFLKVVGYGGRGRHNKPPAYCDSQMVISPTNATTSLYTSCRFPCRSVINLGNTTFTPKPSQRKRRQSNNRHLCQKNYATWIFFLVLVVLGLKVNEHLFDRSLAGFLNLNFKDSLSSQEADCHSGHYRKWKTTLKNVLHLLR